MGCFKFLKVMMFAFNSIIFLAGAVLLGVGIWVKVDSSSILNVLLKLNSSSELNQVLNVGYLLIAVGALLVVIGFLGCCGAIRESKCMLMLFFMIILLVFIAEVVGAIVLLAFRPFLDKLMGGVGAAAVADIQKNYGKNADTTGLWNTTMITLKCCGFNNFTDFTNSTYYQLQGDKYPPFCCVQEKPCNETTAGDKMVAGCLPKIKALLEDNTVVVVGVALGIAVLEICAMIVAMTLFCKIKS